ncbi:hypothetical protein [Ruminococcus flavefaciens]|uniref:Deacetylase PdaC domain-containing protein n=1 Tax=Ruminococcus flavefaciens 007c TaxID=1341157 RepID=W7UX45_RUMFL|nr:hypothetical protein [Ruminococcus flavefaciens]EWM53245.1 hypothetical protein RF007C_09745 [Ruminococcus flavefaciens 007c]
MKNLKIAALIIAAAAGIQTFAGCGKKSDTSSPVNAETSAKSSNAPVVGGTELSGDNYDKEAYYNKITEKVNNAKVDDKVLVLGSVKKDVITPEEGAEDAELGAYRVTGDGIKVYFDDASFKEENVLTLAKYFMSFSAADYNTYQKCIMPSYVTEMDAFLQKEYQYDLKTSFAKQCSNIADKMYGDYSITRIKIEPAPKYAEDKENLDTYFKSLSDIFGKDYYEQVKGESDEIVDACFYVMGEDAYGREQMIVSGYEIVFAVKDGKYYTFG